MGSIQFKQVPSHERVEPGSVNIPLGRFPASASSIPSDPEKISDCLIATLNQHLTNKDSVSIAGLFLQDGYWRDHLALTWDLHTLKGRESITKFLSEGHRLIKIEIDKSSTYRAPHVGPIDGFGDVTGIEFFVLVETDIGSGRGVARLAEEDGQWRIFTLYTALQELRGFEEPLNNRRTKGAEHGGRADRKNWAEKRAADANFEDKDPAVLIVGAGQGGLTVAARLKMLGVEALMIDTNARIGDSWRRRYHQLVLHDPVWYDHMPYLNFPAHWPIFTPKDKIADFFEAYVTLLELNAWTQTRVIEASWSDEKQHWAVTLERRAHDGTYLTRTIHPRHIIQATGHSGQKNLPNINGLDSFTGDRLCHSSEFSGAKAGQGKKAVVVGSCNSAHDIAQDFCEKGYDVTMVQRSSTCVISSQSLTEIGLKGLYDETGPPVEDADLSLYGMPCEVFKAQQVKITKLQNQNDIKTLAGLEEAGFCLDNGFSESGLLFKYYQRGGGYYIDIGASQLIVDGKIKIKHGKEILEVLPHGLRFSDGTELEANELIFATGYQSMKSQTRLVFGDAIANRINDVWGFDDEGEIRSIWRQSGHPGFWYMGGNLAFARYYSRVLALQIKGLEEGLMNYGAR
ncbi:hypothetical protein V496_08552 [Pseudogymnoascus sp. VKM F-4515 (FW-2607)]|nr:hypothetical protein V496_08552 [Pseudogymnoascus sp. VKM F-4515 (FW-2607)]